MSHLFAFDYHNPTRIVFGPDLPTAEVEVSKRYISMFEPDDGEC